MTRSGIIYYSGRFIQRLVMCLAVGATAAYWIILIAITTNLTLASSPGNNTFKDSNAVNKDITRVINGQSLMVLRWVIIASVITALLLVIKRYRKYEKPLIIDSGVILLFCLVSVVLSQAIVRKYLTNILLI